MSLWNCVEDTGENRMKKSSPEVVAKPEASLSVVEAGGTHDEEPREPDWAKIPVTLIASGYYSLKVSDAQVATAATVAEAEIQRCMWIR